jgi:hypothetical protein
VPHEDVLQSEVEPNVYDAVSVTLGGATSETTNPRGVTASKRRILESHRAIVNKFRDGTLLELACVEGGGRLPPTLDIVRGVRKWWLARKHL